MVPFIRKTLHIGIALVWLINGLVCKVLGLVPRHRQIVGRILGEPPSLPITQTIGVLEMLMAVWVLTRIRPKLCTLTQMALVATMNSIEFFMAPDLLLFGHANALFAALFIGVLWLDGFVLQPKQAPKT